MSDNDPKRIEPFEISQEVFECVPIPSEHVKEAADSRRGAAAGDEEPAKERSTSPRAISG